MEINTYNLPSDLRHSTNGSVRKYGFHVHVDAKHEGGRASAICLADDFVWADIALIEPYTIAEAKVFYRRLKQWAKEQAANGIDVMVESLDDTDVQTLWTICPTFHTKKQAKEGVPA